MSETSSEDPVTNLALSLRTVAVAKGSASAKPANGGATDPSYFNTTDEDGLRKAAAAALGTEPTEPQVKAAQKVLQDQAKAETQGVAANTSAGAFPGDFSIEGTAPNVLSGRKRFSIAVWFTIVGTLATVLSVVVLFFPKSTEKDTMLLVILAIVSIAAAYLTVMGFGSIKLAARPNSQDSA